jgi:outer membrane protein assembly factor BamB
VYALDGATGAKKWESAVGTLGADAPTVGPDGTVYVGSHDNIVYALDGKTGAKQWQFATRQSIETAPRLADDVLYVSADKLYALRAGNGHPRWQLETNGKDWSTPVLGARDVLYAGCSNGKIYALDTNTGEARQQFVTDDYLLSYPTLSANDTLYFQCESDNSVYAVDRVTGKRLWKFTEDPLPPAPVKPAGSPSRTGGRGRYRGQ